MEVNMATKSAYDKKPWLKSYPKGVPAEIPALEYSCVGQLIEQSCQKFSDKPIFTCMGTTITYKEYLAQSDVIASWLVNNGFKKGDRVALMMPNVLQMPIVMAGVLRAGCTVVNVNPLYTPRELQHQMKDSGAKAIFVLENFANTVEAVIDETELEKVIVTSMGDMTGGLKGALVNFVVRKVKKLVPAWNIENHISYKSIFDTDNGERFSIVITEPTDLAFLQYTGGTTGVSKGAALTNSNVLSNTIQADIWFEVGYRSKGKPESAVFICALPLYHIFALTVNALMGINSGDHNILIPNPRDIPAFVKELKKWDFHIFPGLNTLFVALLNNPDFRKLNFKSLTSTFGGGMAVQEAVAKEWQDLTGCIITEGYGLSETSPIATGNRCDAKEFSATIGLPLSSTSISIKDDNGKDVPIGKEGEICIKGPQVMAGYWNMPEETANVMTKDGFFKSGDIGVMNAQGYTKIVDRKKDMILVSGFNVYPNEIEGVAVGHPDILEAAAIGIPDEKSGECVKLFIVAKDPALTEQDVKDWCKKGLTNYKRPEIVEFRDDLPKSNVGKILRRELRD